MEGTEISEKIDSVQTTELRVSRYDVQPCKKSHMILSGDQQEKSNVFYVLREIIGRYTQQENIVNSLIF